MSICSVWQSFVNWLFNFFCVKPAANNRIQLSARILIQSQCSNFSAQIVVLIRSVATQLFEPVIYYYKIIYLYISIQLLTKKIWGRRYWEMNAFWRRFSFCNRLIASFTVSLHIFHVWFISRGIYQKPVKDVKEEAIYVHKIFTNAIGAPVDILRSA